MMPFGTIANLISNYEQFMKNAPQQMGNDPNSIIQKLFGSR